MSTKNRFDKRAATSYAADSSTPQNRPSLKQFQADLELEQQRLHPRPQPPATTAAGSTTTTDDLARLSLDDGETGDDSRTLNVRHSPPAIAHARRFWRTHRTRSLTSLLFYALASSTHTTGPSIEPWREQQRVHCRLPRSSSRGTRGRPDPPIRQALAREQDARFPPRHSRRSNNIQ